MIAVVDASVVIKWYVNEIHTPEALHLLDHKVELHAPEMLLPELGNIIWKKFRSKDISETGPEIIIGLFLKQDIILHPHKELLSSAVSGAINTGQTVYDWTYLSLAIALSAPFVTADRRFYNALSSTKFSGHLIWVGDVARFL